MINNIFYSTHGIDSHKVLDTTEKPLILGGVVYENANFCLSANSDGDVILHALTNAVSNATGVNILGKPADYMCKAGITDSAEYLKKAMEYLTDTQKMVRISIAIECARPKITPMITEMRKRISEITGLNPRFIGIHATTGEKLTSFGRGEGIYVSAMISWSEEIIIPDE